MKRLNKISILLFMLLFDFVAFAQFPGDDDPIGGLEGSDPPPTPINSKLIILAIVGVFYIFFKLKNTKEQLN